MSDTNTITAALEGLRCRERELELEAVAVKARVEEIRDMIERLEPRRRPGRPRNASALNPVPLQMPQRVEGGAGQPETQETRSMTVDTRLIVAECRAGELVQARHAVAGTPHWRPRAAELLRSIDDHELPEPAHAALRAVDDRKRAAEILEDVCRG